jgi:hypothetical protein
MNNLKITVALLSGVLALAVSGHAQTVYHVTIRGSCLTTNDSGAIVSEKLNNKSLIQDAVTATGATNSSSLAVVYVQGASSDPSAQGDYIEVVNTTNGVAVYTNLLFLYNSPFPAALTNAAGTEIVAGAQVVPLPLAGSGDSLGGATIHERILRRKVVINGRFNYAMLRSPTSTFNDIDKACSGSFEVGKIFVVH